METTKHEIIETTNKEAAQKFQEVVDFKILFYNAISDNPYLLSRYNAMKTDEESMFDKFVSGFFAQVVSILHHIK